MKKFSHCCKMFEFKKTSKIGNNHYMVLFFLWTFAIALIFFIPIYTQFLLPNLAFQSETSLDENDLLPILTRSLQSNSLPNISTPTEELHPDHLQPPAQTRSKNLTFTRKNPAPETKNFDQKVQNFLTTNACEPMFFMIWISPAALLGKREILAVESVFKSHKNGCLIILSDSLDSPIGKKIFEPISNLGFKILLIEPDIPLLFNQSPAQRWYTGVKTGKIDAGRIPFPQNLSNLMRLVFLYKYGGVYLDTDFIVLRNFSGLRNSIGAQSLNVKTGEWSRLNNAVMIFDKEHPLVWRFIKEFVNGFNGNKWGNNGPYLVSRVIEEVNRENTEKKKMEDGVLNFTVFPPEAFYPVGWRKIRGLYDRPKTKAQIIWAKRKLAQLVSNRTYGIHLWNKQTRGLSIEEGSVMAKLISDHCIICQNIFS